MRIVGIGGLLGLVGGGLVFIPIAAWHIAPLLAVPSSAVAGYLGYLVVRKWNIPILGQENPWLATAKAPDGATYVVRAIVGLLLGVWLGFAFAAGLTNDDETFVILWIIFASVVTLAVTILGDRIVGR